MQNFWTPERHARLVELLSREANYSAKEIAAKLGTTKNAVTGRVYRTGLTLPKPQER